MNKFFNALIVLIAFFSIDTNSQQVVEETVVVTSALVDTCLLYTSDAADE